MKEEARVQAEFEQYKAVAVRRIGLLEADNAFLKDELAKAQGALEKAQGELEALTEGKAKGKAKGKKKGEDEDEDEDS